MNFNTFEISDIPSQYSNTRQENKRILQDRTDEIYKKIPRIKEIDQTITSSYLHLAMNRARGQSEGTTSVSETKETNRKLRQEKIRLLTDAGYPKDYLEPIYTCPICKDTGYVEEQHCSCYTDKLSQTLFLQSNLTNTLKVENFDNFNFDYYSKEIPEGYDFSPYQNITNVVRLTKEFVNNFHKQSSHRGNLFIYGEIGLGKTFLTNCIANELINSAHKVLYLSANELFNEIIAPYIMSNKNELEDLYKYVYNCELLIIDDLGTELINSFTQSHLFEIINKRALTGRSVLISSNKNLQQIKTAYSERVASRIIEHYTILNLYGESVRYQKRFKK